MTRENSSDGWGSATVTQPSHQATLSDLHKHSASDGCDGSDGLIPLLTTDWALPRDSHPRPGAIPCLGGIDHRGTMPQENRRVPQSHTVPHGPTGLTTPGNLTEHLTTVRGKRRSDLSRTGPGQSGQVTLVDVDRSTSPYARAAGGSSTRALMDSKTRTGSVLL